jgi:hypothetical protein
MIVSPPQTMTSASARYDRRPTRAASRLPACRIGPNNQVPHCESTKGSAVIVSQTFIVSCPQTITWALSLDSIVIGERLGTALSGACMPFRRSPS